MIEVTFDTHIEQPVATVFDYLADPSNETEWQSDLIESKFMSPEPHGVGSTGRDVRRFMGRETVTKWEVTELVPNQRMLFQIVEGPLPFEAAYLFESAENGTQLTYTVQAKTSGLTRLFEPLVRRMVRQQGAAQMMALKQALERPLQPARP